MEIFQKPSQKLSHMICIDLPCFQSFSWEIPTTNICPPAARRIREIVTEAVDKLSRFVFL